MQPFRGGLEFKANRLLYHSTLGVSVIKTEEEKGTVALPKFSTRSAQGLRMSDACPRQFRGGLVFKSHRRWYHATLGLRVVIQKKREVREAASESVRNILKVQGQNTASASGANLQTPSSCTRPARERMWLYTAAHTSCLTHQLTRVALPSSSQPLLQTTTTGSQGTRSQKSEITRCRNRTPGNKK